MVHSPRSLKQPKGWNLSWSLKCVTDSKTLKWSCAALQDILAKAAVETGYPGLKL